MKKLTTVYTIELIKLKNTSTFGLISLGALFIPLFLDITVSSRWKMYSKAFTDVNENNWLDYSRKLFNGVHFIFLPLLLIIIIALVSNIEYKSNGWKHLFVMPVSRNKIFISKFLMIESLALQIYCLITLFYLVGGHILDLLHPVFNFSKYPPGYQYGGIHTDIIPYLIKSFLSVQALIAIHFWLSFRIKNTFTVLAIGLGGVVMAVGMFIGHWESLAYFPYGSPLLLCNYRSGAHFLDDFLVSSIVYALFGIIAAYIDFIRFFNA
jgi:hypothetical protein